MSIKDYVVLPIHQTIGVNQNWLTNGNWTVLIEISKVIWWNFTVFHSQNLTFLTNLSPPTTPFCLHHDMEMIFYCFLKRKITVIIDVQIKERTAIEMEKKVVCGNSRWLEHFVLDSRRWFQCFIDFSACNLLNFPFFYPLQTELCTLEAGMDVMPRTPALGPYLNNLVHHTNFHHHTDQTKSLQELQNEVGALLEFRDLVIETFPDLKHKMASSGANSTITGLQSSSIVSRREWEPGIRVRRKLNNGSKEGSGAGEIQSSSLLSRSRSNSHSGKKEPKSGGEGNGSVIQDSGFSTETSSSKEAHSASSTAGSAGNQVSFKLFCRSGVKFQRFFSPLNRATTFPAR